MIKMAKYTTTRQKVKDYIETNILSFLKQKDLNYNKVIELVKLKTSCSENLIQDILKEFINSGKINEIHILTIPDDKIDEWLQEIREMEAQKKIDDKEVKKIFESKKENKNAAKE
ncbi:MAG: hypothetical protein KKF54_04650 [Candidatus Omnitrophica bacterium]|nr:hypothetical protein [Candidatus Omnitrophota bacterium]